MTKLTFRVFIRLTEDQIAGERQRQEEVLPHSVAVLQQKREGEKAYYWSFTQHRLQSPFWNDSGAHIYILI